MNIYRKLQAVVLLCLFQGLLVADVIDIGEISRVDEQKTLPIEIESDSPKIAEMAKKAFRLHGGYKIVPKGEGFFVFNFERKMSDEVALSVELNNPRQVQFSETVKGDTLKDAILKACDIAVEQTLGIPGFFSGKIVFVGEREKGKREVFTSDMLFSSVKQLTHDGSDSVSPKWSPDGSKIIYTSYFNTGFPDIFIMDLNKNERKTVAGYSGTNTGGVFSPKGDKIAMILSSSGNSELYTANINGRSPKRLTKTKALEASPCWSPDGSKIYYTSDEMGGPQLYQYSLRSNKSERIRTNISKYCAEPAVNPVNPDQLVFTAATSGTFQLALYDFDERKSHFITSGSEDYIEAYWLNDGRHVIATRRAGEDERLYIIDTVTGNKAPLHSSKFGKASMASFTHKT